MNLCVFKISELFERLQEAHERAHQAEEKVLKAQILKSPIQNLYHLKKVPFVIYDDLILIARTVWFCRAPKITLMSNLSQVFTNRTVWFILTTIVDNRFVNRFCQR
jgi:hypothetical protein